MVELFTSYFYQVRFMAPTDIPLSTAVWDPKWFHDFQGQDQMFLDRRGVLNGLRASMFAPDSTCQNLCRGHNNCQYDSASCAFLRTYRAQLNKIEPVKFCQFLEGMAPMLEKATGVSGPFSYILLVHEAPNNPCSERAVIQQRFKDAGIDVREWQPPK